MINERMLELLVINSVLSGVSEEIFRKNNGILSLKSGEKVDVNKLIKRQVELSLEFLDPYVINNNLKK